MAERGLRVADGPGALLARSVSFFPYSGTPCYAIRSCQPNMSRSDEGEGEEGVRDISVDDVVTNFFRSEVGVEVLYRLLVPCLNSPISVRSVRHRWQSADCCRPMVFVSSCLEFALGSWTQGTDAKAASSARCWSSRRASCQS